MRALAKIHFHSPGETGDPSAFRMAFRMFGREGFEVEATTVLSAFASSNVHKMLAEYSAGRIAGRFKVAN